MRGQSGKVIFAHQLRDDWVGGAKRSLGERQPVALVSLKAAAGQHGSSQAAGVAIHQPPQRVTTLPTDHRTKQRLLILRQALCSNHGAAAPARWMLRARLTSSSSTCSAGTSVSHSTSTGTGPKRSRAWR
jgi:hypothetical protein